MKTIKLLLLTVLILAVVFAIFVAADCVRLNQSPRGTKPLITVGEEITENRVIYHGLGYSIHYYVDMSGTTEVDGAALAQQLGYGAEFRLFDKIMLWAWIE